MDEYGSDEEESESKNSIFSKFTSLIQRVIKPERAGYERLVGNESRMINQRDNVMHSKVEKKGQGTINVAILSE